MLGKEKFVYLACALILAGIVLYIAQLTIISPSPTQPSQPTPSYTPTSIPAVTTTSNPPVIYNTDESKKALDLLNNPQTLTGNDAATRSKLVSLANKTTGQIRQTNTYRLTYIQPTDDFEVEILTSNVGQAKTDVSTWLQSQGLSKEGICQLPIIFYLNYTVAEQLRNSNFTFSPLADGC